MIPPKVGILIPAEGSWASVGVGEFEANVWVTVTVFVGAGAFVEVGPG